MKNRVSVFSCRRMLSLDVSLRTARRHTRATISLLTLTINNIVHFGQYRSNINLCVRCAKNCYEAEAADRGHSVRTPDRRNGP